MEANFSMSLSVHVILSIPESQRQRSHAAKGSLTLCQNCFPDRLVEPVYRGDRSCAQPSGLLRLHLLYHYWASPTGDSVFLPSDSSAMTRDGDCCSSAVWRSSSRAQIWTSKASSLPQSLGTLTTSWSAVSILVRKAERNMQHTGPMAAPALGYSRVSHTSHRAFSTLSGAPVTSGQS